MSGIWGNPVFLAVILSVFAFLVFRTVSGSRKKARGNAVYSLSFHSDNHPLTPQLFADTSGCAGVFSRQGNLHDAAFEAQYPVGGMLSFNGESHLISRRQKYLSAEAGRQPQFGYALYFQAFEKSEFPLLITFAEQRHYRHIFLDEEGCTLTAANGKATRLPYAQLCFKAREKRLTLKTDREEHIVKRSELRPADRQVLEAVLQKYAASINLDPDDFS